MIAIATMPSMSFLLDFDLAGVANSSSDLAPERLSVLGFVTVPELVG
jgi:hypothetical protein